MSHVDMPIGRFVVIARGLGWGTLLGVVAGGAVGTAQWPIVGTFFGALAGAVVGGGFGLVGGVVLVLLASSESGPAPLAVIAAASTLVCAALVAVAVHLTPVQGCLFVAVSAVLGAAVGPRVAKGPAVSDELLGWLGRGAAAGFGSGAAAGIVIGALGDSPRTAGAAAVEGALLGVPAGLLCGAVVAVLVVAIRAVR